MVSHFLVVRRCYFRCVAVVFVIFLGYLSSELLIFLRIERHLAAKTVTNSAVFVLKVFFASDDSYFGVVSFFDFVVIRAIFIVYG